MDLGISLDSTLYLNLLGYPSETTSEFAVLGGALYVPENADVIKDANGYYVWPEVSDDAYDTMMDVGMGNIKTSATDIGVGISQYNINQMLSGLMENLKVMGEGHQPDGGVVWPQGQGGHGGPGGDAEPGEG